MALEKVVTLSERDAMALKQLLAMSKQKIGSAVVSDHNEIVGIFTSTDALNALVEILRGQLP